MWADIHSAAAVTCDIIRKQLTTTFEKSASEKSKLVLRTLFKNASNLFYQHFNDYLNRKQILTIYWIIVTVMLFQWLT